MVGPYAGISIMSGHMTPEKVGSVEAFLATLTLVPPCILVRLQVTAEAVSPFVCALTDLALVYWRRSGEALLYVPLAGLLYISHQLLAILRQVRKHLHSINEDLHHCKTPPGRVRTPLTGKHTGQVVLDQEVNNVDDVTDDCGCSRVTNSIRERRRRAELLKLISSVFL